VKHRRGPATLVIVTMVAGSAAVVAGLALAIAPPGGVADFGTVPAGADSSPSSSASVVLPATATPPVLGSGTLAVPDDPRRVGWWIGGARPGDPTGTVTIAGHVDDRARPGALFRLAELPIGAMVYVDGETRRFSYRVAARRVYRKQRLPAEVFDRGVPHRLVLITCGGPFHDGHYDDNVIVYASAVP